MAATGVCLFEIGDASKWKDVLALYPEILARKASDMKKSDKAKKLLQLDKWFQEELPTEISKRSEKFITLEELTKLMDWKLTRGKFRPRLMQLVQTNSPEGVTEITKEAFGCLPNIDKAMQIATKLKAVGPATASAILCAGSSNVPFMADEAMQAIPGFGRLDYTTKCYQTYLAKIRTCVARLAESDPEGDWNEHMVELCLWSEVVARKGAPELLREKPAVKRPVAQEASEESPERRSKCRKFQGR